MKRTFLKGIILPIFIATTSFIGTSTFAQTAKKDAKSTITVKVSEEGENGKFKETYKEYQVNNMSGEDRKKFVDKVLDSLDAGPKSKGKIVSVTVDDGDTHMMTKKRRTAPNNDKGALALNFNEDFDFNFDTEKMRTHMRNFERDFRPKLKAMTTDIESFGNRMGDVFERTPVKSSSIRGLSAYSNNPDNGVLNLRFQVPAKGDVNITITDVKGKEVGKKEIKDFSGSFVGQVDLKKNTKGTLFITVVQNEDGAVQRVVIP